MNKILLLLLFIIPLSLFGQVESQFNGTLNVFSASRIGFTNTFTISGIFTSTTTSYTSANSAVGDIVQVQSGSRFYWMHIYSIASNSGGVITCNVRDSSSTLTTFPTGKWSIFRPTPNLRLPLSPDGETNASKSATFNTLALRVDEIQSSVASATNCERTITKSSHGFSKWTPLYWTGSTYVRPPYDSLVPDYIVVDSLTANTFVVAFCGTYPTTLADGLYWFTGTAPGYSLTEGEIKVPLFQVIDSVLVLNPIVGFNLNATSGGGSDGNGIYSGSDSLSQENTYAAMAADGSQSFALGHFPSFPNRDYAAGEYGLYVSPAYGGEISLFNFGSSNYIEHNLYSGGGNFTAGVLNKRNAGLQVSTDNVYLQARANVLANALVRLRVDSTGVWVDNTVSAVNYVYKLVPLNNAPSPTSSAISTLTWTAGTPSFLRSQHGVATGTTDGSGDLTVTFAAAMPDTTYTLLVTPEGTTYYTTTVHTKGTSTVKVRFFDAAGAAVTSTSVTISYEAKDY